MDPQPVADDRVTATSIMIKIMIDQYCTRDLDASAQLLALFFELLEGNNESKVHAFNLLFNLAVHVNMYDEYFPKLGADHAKSAHYFDRTFAVSFVLLAHKKKCETTGFKVVREIEDDLFDKLCEMLLWILHRRVTDRAVWLAAFNCTLTFICNHGEIDKDRYGPLFLVFRGMFASP